jgi:hypothetical protein
MEKEMGEVSSAPQQRGGGKACREAAITESGEERQRSS